MNKSLLVVCPTRNRPERCREMLESFKATVTVHSTRLVFYVDEADPRRQDYDKMFSEGLIIGTTVTFGQRKTVPDVYNTIFNTTYAEYYSDANDDFIYHTKDWDQKLISAIEANGGLGMAYGKTKNLPTACVWSAKSLRALGYWMPSGFVHQFIDDVHRDLFAQAGQLYYVPEVDTEHRHAAFGCVPWDQGYEEIYKTDNARKDAEAYQEWLKTKMAADLKKLKSAAK